jgi:hypothetical protein
MVRMYQGLTPLAKLYGPCRARFSRMSTLHQQQHQRQRHGQHQRHWPWHWHSRRQRSRRRQRRRRRQQHAIECLHPHRSHAIHSPRRGETPLARGVSPWLQISLTTWSPARATQLTRDASLHHSPNEVALALVAGDTTDLRLPATPRNLHATLIGHLLRPFITRVHVADHAHARVGGQHPLQTGSRGFRTVGHDDLARRAGCSRCPRPRRDAR